MGWEEGESLSVKTHCLQFPKQRSVSQNHGLKWSSLGQGVHPSAFRTLNIISTKISMQMLEEVAGGSWYIPKTPQGEICPNHLPYSTPSPPPPLTGNKCMKLGVHSPSPALFSPFPCFWPSDQLVNSGPFPPLETAKKALFPFK